MPLCVDVKLLNEWLIDSHDLCVYSGQSKGDDCVGLGQEFWALVVDTACYLKNRSPTSTLVDKTPYEVWFGQKPSVAHLRVFGCEAFVHVPKEKRSKLDNKAEKCIFVGYKDGIKGYKLWNPITRKGVYS